MKMLNKISFLATAIGVAAFCGSAHASFVGTDYGTTASLSSLVDGGGYLAIGDKTFADFAWSGGAGLDGWDPSQISVTASIDQNGVYLLTWNGKIQTQSSADLTLNYSVTASAGMISMIDQSYTGSALASIDETVASDPNGLNILASSHLGGLISSETTGPNLYVNPAQSVLYVTKDIALSTSETFPLSSVSVVSQSFHQTAVPEPSTIVAGALLLLPFGVSTLRILRKNKVS